MGMRKNQSTLTADEKARFINAVLLLKENGTYDSFVAQHRDAMLAPNMPAHMMPAFLPWHREFLRRFELALQTIDSSVSIPYWDWTVDRLANSSLWRPDFMGGDGESVSRRVTTGPFAFAAGRWNLNVTSPDAPGPALRRTLGPASALPTASQVTAALNSVPYDSPPWMNSINGFRPLLEGLHNRVHPWVGGSMGGPTSPNDPVFFLHHAYIDLLWARWQALHPDQQPYLPLAGGPLGHNLNDPMSPWGAAATPASVINHRSLGYWYDIDVVTPIVLTIGAAPYQASIGSPGEEDAYSFVVPAAGTFRIETQGPTDTVMSLFGPNSQTTLVAENDDTDQDRNARIVSRLTAGTYYARIRHYQASGTGEYRISVRGETVTIPQLQVNGPPVQGSIDADNESDIYTFTAAQTGIYTLETEGNTDTFLTLFGPNSQSRLIAQDDDSGPDLNSKIAADLIAGVYFLRVRHFSQRGRGPYRISVKR